MLKIAVPRLYEPMTAYDFLLGPLTTLVREDPKRMRMREWATDVESLRPRERPICGTVCCIGGWTEMLVNGHDVPDSDPCSAQHILNLTPRQADELFYTTDLIADEDQGTPAHAERVIAHIADFCDMHQVKLKATTVRPT